MEASEVASLVERYQKEKDHIHNEEETKTKLIVPFLRLLGYNPESGNQVRLEYRGDFQTKATKPAKDSEPMDYAIFDRDDRPIMVIEAKKLGGDVQARSAQLGVYVNKMAGLHLGIITDGCEYLFYADLDAPNVMDDKPFYRFSLAETATDWGQVASFLTKLSCKNFSNETLTIDAENCRYRQAMVEKLIAVMRAPNSDHDFMSEWLCKGLLPTGKKVNKSRLARFAPIADEAMREALRSAISEQLLDRLLGSREQGASLTAPGAGGPGHDARTATAEAAMVPKKDHYEAVGEIPASKRNFYEALKSICSSAGVSVEEVIWSDQQNYLNISIGKPKSWFIRLFGTGKRAYITTLVPCAEAKALCPGFEVDPGRPESGKSRVYMRKPNELDGLERLILRSFAIRQAG